MPGFDGTGPAGMGPMTGGGRGVCNPYSASYWPYAAWQPGARGPAYGPAFGWAPVLAEADGSVEVSALDGVEASDAV